MPIKTKAVIPAFVDIIPDRLEEGTLYICERYNTAIHKCCCGCGEEVVTPLTPAGWSVTKQGDRVSLSPSIGNWDYECRSHYLIISNQVVWAGALSQRQVEQVKARDKADNEAYIAAVNLKKYREASLWFRFAKFLRSFFRR